MGIGGMAIKFLTTCCFGPWERAITSDLAVCRHATGPSELKVFGFSATGIYITRVAFVSSIVERPMYIYCHVESLNNVATLKSTACEEKQSY